MAIPGYQAIMLPIMLFLRDEKEHTSREIMDAMASKFSLSEDEKKTLLQCGQPLYENRVGWAKTYLKKAGLISSPRRGVNVITPRGLDVLSKKPSSITDGFLRQFPEFVEFIQVKKVIAEEAEKGNDNTPEEVLDAVYKEMRGTLVQELVAKIMAQSPDFFERLVVELLVKMGYGGSIKDAGKAIGRSGDEGIDGTIKEDKLGLDVIYIQAKRWNPDFKIGRPEIQKFVGALAGQGAKKGIFITTALFSKDALSYQPKNETKVVLIDGEMLAQLMTDYNVGVASVNIYELKRIDNDYFMEE